MILLDGEVRWAKKVPLRYAYKIKSGMGLLVTQIKEGQEIFQSFCPRDVCILCTPLPGED
jgi:hypothetical protein